MILDINDTLIFDETKIIVLPELYFVKLDKIGNKIPVVIFNLKKIEKRLEPKNKNIYYSTTSKCEVNNIIKYYESIKEFNYDNINNNIMYNKYWKDEIIKKLI
jgi:hypothetical protein